MSTIVIMPGGFHPFHAGHAALYQSAVKAFPGAEVFVAATNDTSNRPFPFAIKEKLAKLAGVAPGHFVQVKSPFRAEEITAKFDPAKDRLIFVRSEKDADKPPQAGGVKKNGEPAYLQPLAGQTNIAPFGKHAYMAYLPTVEFGPGMTSATQIRSAWPGLDERRKTALVMSLYPKAQGNARLAATVVKLLDAAIGGEQGVAEGNLAEKINPKTLTRGFVQEKDMGWYTLQAVGDLASRMANDPPTMEIYAMLKPEAGKRQGKQIGQLSLKIAQGVFLKDNPGAEALVAGGVDVDPAYQRKGVASSMYQFAKELGNDVIASVDQSDDAVAMWKGMQAKGVAEGAPIVVALAPIDVRNPKKAPQPYRNQGDIVPPTKPPSTEKRGVKGRPGQRPMPDHDVAESNMLGSVMFKSKPPKLKKIQPAASRTKDFMKKDFSLSEDDEVDENQGWAATFTNEETGQMAGTPAIGGMWAGYQDRENQPIGEDYVEEKWSQKYKSSINCDSPKGFSQRAHCAGRKK
jgi:GNAT superfamily N-acetyltransferase